MEVRRSGILLESKDGSSGFGNLRQRLGRSPGKGDAAAYSGAVGGRGESQTHWGYEENKL
jgi:hypothetical protein